MQIEVEKIKSTDKLCPFCKEHNLRDFPEHIIYSSWPGWEGYRIQTSCTSSYCTLKGHRLLTSEEVEDYRQLGYSIPEKR